MKSRLNKRKVVATLLLLALAVAFITAWMFVPFLAE
jgi:F0F1-type ATP synthase assembly protein I